MTQPITLTTISFPEINLPQGAAAKLRGYFGDYFREHSPLLHNHYDDGRSVYRYPLVQYKVRAGIPTLVGIQEGAHLMAELFFKIKQLRIEGREYPVMERDIAFKVQEIGVGQHLTDYTFETLWMALNQKNYAEYSDMEVEERRAFLGRILTGNMLSFFKGVGLFLPPEARIMTVLRLEAEKSTLFKEQKMVAFKGAFTTNAILPDLIGLGKSVSRGFGSIKSA